MKQRPRIHYTESQKALMWERWQKGEALQQIAQLFDRNHSSIQLILAATGGIRPAPRCRSRLALTLAEREEISRVACTSTTSRRTCHSSPITLPSEKPDGRVEVPHSADFDHVDLVGQCRRERLVVLVALHDAPYRFIDFRHATGENESH
jgi:hypothetical protein